MLDETHNQRIATQCEMKMQNNITKCQLTSHMFINMDHVSTIVMMMVITFNQY